MKLCPFVPKKLYDGLLVSCKKNKNRVCELEMQTYNLKLKQKNILGMLQVLTAEKYSQLLKVIELDNSVGFISRQISFDNLITINLHILDSAIHYNVAHLFAYYQDIGSVFLDDIQCESNHGYGTILINELICICQSQNIHCITGQLAPVDLTDKEHEARLLHFYEKHGFIIDSGKKYIRLNL